MLQWKVQRSLYSWDGTTPSHSLGQCNQDGFLQNICTLPYYYFLKIRAWCLLEVFYNTKNGVPFEVYLTEEQRRQFLELTLRNPGQAMLIFSRISTRQSTCWVLNDQLRIHSLIESSVGFEAVDTQGPCRWITHHHVCRANKLLRRCLWMPRQ